MAEESESGVTKVLMVVAVLAVITSVIGVIGTLNKFNNPGTGYASSGEGNVTLEIQQVINLNFTNNLINWSSGYVNTTTATPCFGNYAVLDTNNTADPVSQTCSAGYPTTGWQAVNRGLIISTAGSSLPIAINISSDKNALQLLGSADSTFMWKVQEYNIVDGFEDSCDNTLGALAPTTYTTITAGSAVRICNRTNFVPAADELRVDFQVNVSKLAPAQSGYRTAIITATGWLP